MKKFIMHGVREDLADKPVAVVLPDGRVLTPNFTEAGYVTDEQIAAALGEAVVEPDSK